MALDEAAVADLVEAIDAAVTAPTFALKPGGKIKGKWSAPARWQETTGHVADPAAVVEDGGAVGMVCGHEFDVIDIDPRNGGDLGDLQKDGLIPPVRRMVRTQSGGCHLYIDPLGLEGHPAPGVDYLGANRFVFAPPTAGYEDVPEDEWPTPSPGAERALRGLLGRQKTEPEAGQGEARPTVWVDDLDAYLAAALDREVRDLSLTHVGDRDNQLNRSAFALGQLIPAGLDEDEARERLTEAAREIGLDDADIRRALRSGLEAGKREPRDVREGTAGAAALERDITNELHRLRVRDAAQTRFNAERLAKGPMPRLVGLSAFLDEPDESTTYRIEGLWPTGGRVMLAAGQKAGKTTLVGNVLRSLADGAPFLGSYATEAAPRTVLIDNEMAEGQIRRWLRDQDIKDTDAVDVVPLRGRLSSFNIIDAASRRRWAELLGAADVLIFDCLRPVLDALGLDENHDAGRFLEALDELACEAGIGELLVVHHMGHGSERARGDSRIQDWPDANWRLVPTKGGDGQPDEHGPRYFWARGRDVEQPEAMLGFDPATRHLTIDGGSRRQQTQDAAALAVLGVVKAAGEPLSGRGITDATDMGGVSREAILKALASLVRDGQLIKERRTGRGGGFEYSLPGGEITDEGEA